jgi:hypothetical protein
MKPDFSEFSYGYALTEELANKYRSSLAGAPIFPSLYQEGQMGGGYDVQLPIEGFPIFLQFKLSDKLERKNAKEFKKGLLNLPFYRMHIRPKKHSNQHNLLLDLERAGNTVFYIAPQFHLPEELNKHYLNRSIVANSAAFSPSAIGEMLDDDEHYVVFESGGYFGYRCSDEAIKIKKLNLSDGFYSVLNLIGKRSIRFDESTLPDLANEILLILEKTESLIELAQATNDLTGIEKIVSTKSAFESISYMTRTFFDSAFLIIPSE